MGVIHTGKYYTFLFLIYVFCILSCTTAQGGATIKEQAAESQSAVVNQTATSSGTISDSAAGGNIQPQSTKLKMAQLIIKFRSVNFDPTQGDYLQKLSYDIKATLAYLRPMSGGAHVFRVMDISDNTQLTMVIRRLSERSEILYVEQDRIMQHQKVQ